MIEKKASLEGGFYCIEKTDWWSSCVHFGMIRFFVTFYYLLYKFLLADTIKS